jgi:Hypothetical protein (DUF2513)
LKRDMDLIRDILLKIEGGQRLFEPISSDTAAALGTLETPISREEADRLSGHLDLLEKEGFIAIEMRSAAGAYWVKGLTSRGHDFLERGQNTERPLMSVLKEPEHITLPEGLILLQNSGLSTEDAKVRLRQAFVRKAFLQAPLFAFEYDDADIDWATGSVKISKKKDRFVPTFSRSDFNRYFFHERVASPSYRKDGMSSRTDLPDIKWYLRISAERGVTPRCPFASVERCPRYYQSLSALGRAKISVELAPDEDKRLHVHWEKSELWPKSEEDSTHMFGNGEKFLTFSNFCPEVTYERFGHFAGQLVDYYDAAERYAAHQRLEGENCPSESWQWEWASLKPLHFTECPLYSPLSHAADATKQQPKDVLTLNPGIWGINVNLIELVRRCGPLLKRLLGRSSS